MLSVLLTIGKGLAILLLALFLLLLFLLGLVLFVPVRYRGNAEKSDSIKAFCRLGWLFPIVSFCVAYEDGEVRSGLRIFGILWKRKEKKAPPKTENSAKESIEAKESTEVKESSKRKEKVSKDTENSAEGTSEIPAGTEKLKREQPTPEKNAKSAWEKLLTKLEKMRYTITHIYGKILHIKENLSEYLAIWQAAETQAAFAKCKKEFLHLLLHLKPKKLRAEVLFGMDDPALTGEILGAFSIFYPYLGENVFIQPDFERTVFMGKASFKGRLRMGTLLLIGVRLYFDQNIRGLIKKFRKEKTDGRE